MKGGWAVVGCKQVNEKQLLCLLHMGANESKLRGIHLDRCKHALLKPVCSLQYG